MPRWTKPKVAAGNARCASVLASAGTVAGQQGIHREQPGDVRGRPDRRVDTAGTGQQTEAAVEHVDQQQPQPECRHGNAADRDGARDLVDGAVARDRREHAERYAEQHRQQQGVERQFDRGREEQPQILEHRPLGADGNAEIAVQQFCDVGDVLLRHRPIQAEFGANVSHRLLGGALARHHARRIARDQVRNGEGDDADAEHHEDEKDQPAADDVGEGHGCRRRLAGAAASASVLRHVGQVENLQLHGIVDKSLHVVPHGELVVALEQQHIGCLRHRDFLGLVIQF